jgi:hypothetical protein
MIDYLLMTVAATVIFVALVLVWLLRQQHKLKQDCRLLAEQLQRNNEDVAGLCSAAVAVDQRLAANDARLADVIEAVNATYQAPQPVSVTNSIEELPQDYGDAIQKIRYGAGVDELVKDCGLTRDEAVLLIRLHGGKR